MADRWQVEEVPGEDGALATFRVSHAPGELGAVLGTGEPNDPDWTLDPIQFLTRRCAQVVVDALNAADADSEEQALAPAHVRGVWLKQAAELARWAERYSIDPVGTRYPAWTMYSPGIHEALLSLGFEFARATQVKAASCWAEFRRCTPLHPTPSVVSLSWTPLSAVGL